MNADRWRALARVLLFMFLCAVVLATVGPMAPAIFGIWRAAVIGLAASAAALGLTALFVRWERLRMRDAGAALATGTAARLAIGFLLGSILVGVWALMSFAAGNVRWERDAGFDGRATVAALAGYLSLASREELAFHGYPLRRLERYFGLFVAQIFVAVVFVIEHKLGGSPWVEAVLGPGVGSLLFGMAAIATRGLALPIGLHAAWNFGQWTLGLRGGSGFWKPVAVTSGQDARAYVVAMTLTVVVMGAATLGFWFWDRRARRDIAEH